MELNITDSNSNSNDNRCRACMTDVLPGKMVSLFDDYNLELFSRCTSLEISPSDELPDYVCSECFTELQNVHQFRQKCLKSDTQFKSEILKSKSLPIKLELELINAEDKPQSNDVLMNSISDEHINECKSNNTSHEDYVCDKCNSTFKRKSKLHSHMANHAPLFQSDSIKLSSQIHCNLFDCHIENSNKSYSTSRELRRHIDNLHPKPESLNRKPQNQFERKGKLFCPKCPKWFSIQVKLDGHIRRYHEGLKEYKCEEEMCGKEFNKLRSFRLHVDTFHKTKELPKFQCDYEGCNKVYNLSDSLRSHINIIHLKRPVIKTDQSLICETCGKSCRNAYSLKVHGYSHTGDFPFACSRCPRKLESSYKLKIHVMKHLNIKNFVCPHCGLRKTTNRELQHHLNVHSDEKKFQCKECTQAFNTYSALNNHVRIHHKKYRPYACSHCQRTFAKKGTMRNHEMTHTGEKPYACSICGHRFIQAVSLRLHLKVHANPSKCTRSKKSF